MASSTFHCYVYFSNFAQFVGSSFQINLPKTLISSCRFLAWRLTMFPKLNLNFSPWNSSFISRVTYTSIFCLESKQINKLTLFFKSHFLYHCLVSVSYIAKIWGKFSILGPQLLICESFFKTLQCNTFHSTETTLFTATNSPHVPSSSDHFPVFLNWPLTIVQNIVLIFLMARWLLFHVPFSASFPRF